MRIQNKLFFTLIVTSIIAVAILVTVMQWSVRHGMVDYLNKRDIERLKPLATQLAEEYQTNQSWQWLQDRPFILKRILIENALLTKKQSKYCDEEGCDKKKKHDHHMPHKLTDIALFDLKGQIIVALNLHAEERMKVPVKLNGEKIAWLSVPNRKEISEGFEFVFIKQQRKAFWVMSLIVIVLSGGISYLLARHFVRPIEQLTKGANELTQGNYKVNLPAERNDELGLLARDFNELAKTLGQNEHSRKRWLADISHELRTPLAILAAEIEAMIDGVRPLSQEGIVSMKEEVGHLSKLVNDLYELTKADIGGLSYRKSETDLVELIQHKLKQHQPVFDEREFDVQFNFDDAQHEFWADSTRINQLLDNLFTNCVRYTHQKGQISISLLNDVKSISLLIEDSAPGVPDESLQHLFDYLYRTEQSRNRENGGSGLGLAICKRIVEGHDGTISAHHSSLGGVAIHIKFPI